MAEMKFNNFNETKTETEAVIEGMGNSFVSALVTAETHKAVQTAKTCKTELKDFVKVGLSRKSTEKQVKKSVKRLDKAMRKNKILTHTDCVSVAAGVALGAAPVYALGNAVLGAVALGKDIVEWRKEVKAEKAASK